MGPSSFSHARGVPPNAATPVHFGTRPRNEPFAPCVRLADFAASAPFPFSPMLCAPTSKAAPPTSPGSPPLDLLPCLRTARQHAAVVAYEPPPSEDSWSATFPERPLGVPAHHRGMRRQRESPAQVG